MADQEQQIDLDELIEYRNAGKIEPEKADVVILRVLTHYLTIVIRKTLNNHAYEEDVLDILTMSLQKIWTNLETYSRDKGSVHTWASTIAKRTAIDFLRSQQRESKHLDASYEIQDVAVPGFGVEEMLEVEDVVSQRNMILSAAVGFEKIDMAIFFIRVHYNLTFAEIAEVMTSGGHQLTNRAVENRFYRTRDKIRELVRRNLSDNTE